MANEHFELRGLDTLDLKMANTQKAGEQLGRDGLEDVAMDVLNESQTQVPVHYGILKGSGHIEGPELVGDSWQVSVRYGGAAAGYALWVHENLSASHKPPGKAKYLEDPANEAISKLPEMIRGKMEAAILGDYTSAPTKAGAAEVMSSMGAARKMMKSGRTFGKNINTAPAMTPKQVHAAFVKLRSQAQKRGK